ncbi:oxygenase MpaB family protein [Nocardia yamanashiensis]|uniref:oxygenase MpaB family protein n=1 Tax=Nocardia yamanashiensis TaxID=209247 RepID=UPI000A054411|nr:oxygenase MpaB family protein [Nocardia yamanashiensis]
MSAPDQLAVAGGSTPDTLRDTESAFPTRFYRDPEWSRRLAAPLKRFIRGECEPGPADWELIRDSLTTAEPVGAELAAAIKGRQVSMKQFRQALADGGAVDAPEALRRYFARLEQRPDWVRDDLLARGATVVRQCGRNGIDVITIGLLSGYRASATTDLLVRTGGLRGTGTARRIGETAKWWFECIQPGGLDRSRQGWQLTAHVRLMHAMVNQHFESREEWDERAWGKPINQADLAGTYHLFCTSFLITLRLLGMRINAADGYAVMHLWRYIGWLTGIDERLLSATEEEARKQLFHLTLATPAGDANSVLLADALVESRKHLNIADDRARAYEYRRFRSLAAFYLGSAGMRELRLRMVFPWYPAVRAPRNLLVFTVLRAVPGGDALLTRMGERELEVVLREYFGDDAARLGPDPYAES